MDVRFERWETDLRFVVSIRNGTSRAVTVYRVVSDSGMPFVLPAIKPRVKTLISPNETLPIWFKQSPGPPQYVVATVVPWTFEEESAARNKYGNWPTLVKKLFLHRYTIKPEHIHKLSLPAHPQS